MSEFLRNLEDTLHFPDRLIHSITHPNPANPQPPASPRNESSSAPAAPPSTSAHTSPPHGQPHGAGLGAYQHGPPFPYTPHSSARIVDYDQAVSRSDPSASGQRDIYYEPRSAGGRGSEGPQYSGPPGKFNIPPGGGESNPFLSQYQQQQTQQTHEPQVSREAHTQAGRYPQQPAGFPRVAGSFPGSYMGESQVLPSRNELYPNPTGGGASGYSEAFSGFHAGDMGQGKSTASAGGDRDREGEQYGRADADAGQRLRDRDLPASHYGQMAYSERQGESGQGVQFGAREMVGSYEAQGVGRWEAATRPGDGLQGGPAQSTRNELGELGVDTWASSHGVREGGRFSGEGRPAKEPFMRMVE
ncbi:hypothetical protein BDZ91DRAFT_811792 [Kalaharituber pfeilii]|nr:hypothetical protein BDZ91DRAFT_811792 [Kalaharituber pfeilii]